MFKPASPAVGPLLCIIDGLTRRTVVRRRRAPRVPLARDGVALNVIERQLGHASVATTSIYLQGIGPEEIITAVRTRRAPMMSASAGLRL